MHLAMLWIWGPLARWKGTKQLPNKNPCQVKKCQKCKTFNKVARTCYQKPSPDQATSPIAELNHTTSYKHPLTTNNHQSSMEEIPTILSACLCKHRKIQSVEMNIFSDPGANICLAGLQHITELNLDVIDWISCNKETFAVEGSKLNCTWWLSVIFQIRNKITQKPLYISNKIDKIYFSKQGPEGPQDTLSKLSITESYWQKLKTSQYLKTLQVHDHGSTYWTK